MEVFSPVAAALFAALVLAGPIAVVVTKVVDFIRNLFDTSHRAPSWVWNLVALGTGLVVAFLFGINLLHAIVAAIPALSDRAGTQDVLGQALTGLMLGAMAGFWHDKMAQWSSQHVAIEPAPGLTVTGPVTPTATTSTRGTTQGK